jgi:ribonuclease R
MSKKTSQKSLIRNEILDVFQKKSNALLNYKQLAAALKIRDKQLRALIIEVLRELTDEGKLREMERGKYKAAHIVKRVLGRLEMTRKGVGYVICPDREKDIFIDKSHLSVALHGDEVAVELFPRSRRQDEGRIVEIITRSERPIVGILKASKNNTFLVPDDTRYDTDVYIKTDEDPLKINGQRAVVKILDWPESAKSPFGKIIELLGAPGSNDAEMRAILIANGIRIEFPQAVIDEADRIATMPTNADFEGRTDFREILTFTIDPVDARDFDDALSVEFLDDDQIRLGVHIADVSHYVRENGQLDKEALLRGNSVYLVDRVVPMLPEHLSNIVCSLRPEEVKLTFSVVFVIDKQGIVQSDWFGKTIIRSARRFTYEEAQQAIVTGNDPLAPVLQKVNELAKKIRNRRLKEGALEVTSSEVRFELDNKGQPVRVYKKEIQDSNKLIEEYMLLANKHVAMAVGGSGKKESRPLIYRIHDLPDEEKLKQFAMFVSKFGHKFQYNEPRSVAKRMNELFQEMKGEPELAVVQQMAIKSMAKAVYDTDNIGHFGLAFRYYAHFTSPIRRYADLVVHRILQQYLEHRRGNYKGLKEIAKHISATERRATDAERASDKFFQAKYLEARIGEKFHGFVSGLTEWGIYVQLEENFCEGMISLKSLAYDRFYFDERSYRVIGSKTGEIFNLGDRVEVELIAVSIAKKQIDLELVY